MKKCQKMKTITPILMLYIISNAIGDKKDNSLIYILLWTANMTPVLNNEQGQLYFINRKCGFQNCFVTSNKSHFRSVKEFDVILFNSRTLDYNITFPSIRSEDQRYVFLSEESPAVYPLPKGYNGFFNLTWTYKLDSDATWRFLVIRNKNGEIIGPSRKNIKWIDFKSMEPTNDETKRNLRKKHKAVAWFVSHCDTPSRREDLAQSLNEELGKYNLKVDFYGQCYNPKCAGECGKTEGDKCFELIESDYYFYLSFENSMCEDYVTEKVLIATKHYAVPIVNGGADYSRFLPPGSYLDVNSLGHGALAAIMNDTIVNKEKYYDYFKWHNHYSIHASNESADSDEICAFCAFLNDKKHSYTRSVYTHLNLFWPYYN